MPILSRESILAASLHKEAFDVPSLGGTVYIRVMNGHERAAFSGALETLPEGAPESSRIAATMKTLLILTLCDETGARYFGADDGDALMERPGDALQDLFLEALRINKLRAEDLEDTKKNYLPTASDDSGIVLP